MASEAFWAGGAGGAAGILVTQPLDTVRIRMQAAGSGVCGGLAGCARATLAAEGAAGLWKGVCSPMATAGAMNALLFVAQDAALARLGDGASAGQQAAAGVAAGAASAFITSPTELVKCNAQLDTAPHRGRFGGLRAEIRIAAGIWRNAGVQGLFCGLPLTVLRDGLSFGVYFGSYSLARGELVAYGVSATSASFCAGGCAGVAAWASIYPIDVIKTHWQTGRRMGAASAAAVAAAGVRAHGWQWLVRGLAATLLRAWPQHAVTFVVYERVRGHLSATDPAV
eukprot:TRINITY_DN27680_c0_g1_i2.p1 TRINITY_DN27680_c0_g1~~TRINITY_DN27680_c0_g1_i2.p1  ORF type:complete len:312 (+),score=51.21 TRINITY_DN27680_c0_g1_i2:92-937(+)